MLELEMRQSHEDISNAKYTDTRHSKFYYTSKVNAAAAATNNPATNNAAG